MSEMPSDWKCFDVGRLDVLRSVASTGSLSGAARELSYTVSAISQQIARLEREVGTQLVVRTPRGVVLTEPGRIMVRHAAEVHSSAGLARARLRALASLDDGYVRVGSVASFTATLLPDVIRAIQQRAPNIAMEVHSAKIDGLIDMVRRYDVDLAIIWLYSGDPTSFNDGMTLRPLFTDPLCVVLPQGHRLLQRRLLRLEDLSGEVIITARHTFLLAALRRATRFCPPRRIHEANDYQEAQGLVSAGLGVAIIPTLVARNLHTNVQVRSLAVNELPDRNFLLALPAQLDPSPACLATIEALETCYSSIAGTK